MFRLGDKFIGRKACDHLVDTKFDDLCIVLKLDIERHNSLYQLVSVPLELILFLVVRKTGLGPCDGVGHSRDGFFSFSYFLLSSIGIALEKVFVQQCVLRAECLHFILKFRPSVDLQFHLRTELWTGLEIALLAS